MTEEQAKIIAKAIRDTGWNVAILLYTAILFHSCMSGFH